MPDFAAPSLGLAAMCETMGAVILGGVLGLMYEYASFYYFSHADVTPSRSYGVTIHQVYRYFAMYPADRASLKFFVRSHTPSLVAHVADLIGLLGGHIAVGIHATGVCACRA